MQRHRTTLTVGNLSPVPGAVVQQPTAPPGSTVAISRAVLRPGYERHAHRDRRLGRHHDVDRHASTETAGTGTVSASHLYATDDNYTVTVTITDDNGGAGVAYASR